LTKTPTASAPTATLTQHTITVLLVDDQAIVGEAVRRMLAGETDIVFHYCSDPVKAIQRANEIRPTVILQDLVMPEVDGLTLVKFIRANPRTRDVPLIVLSTKEEPAIKAQAFALGANDYLVKLPDKLELLARIRYHSKGYINLLQRNEAFGKLQESLRMLAEEVGQAAQYVRSLLPPPVKGKVLVDWKFIPSTQLGGDSFGYHWLDKDHFALYLLDVSGHGVGASLMSVSAMNVLTARALPKTDFRNPSQVLHALNDAFQMEKHDGRYFTIWYGVYTKSTRQLAFAGAGHPSQLLLQGPDPAGAKVRELVSQGPVLGMLPDFPFESETLTLDPYARLFLFSDGVFEIEQPDGSMWKFNDFKQLVESLPPGEEAPIDHILQHVYQVRGSNNLADDFSLVLVTF
jgi:sigma-B regulation protein RsbU (phosphoserine phosphatase)